MGAKRERLAGIRDRHGIRMLKYLAGSIVAMIVSTVTFLATFGPGLLGSKGASLTASATGAIVNYFMNRRWAWGRRDRGDLRREVMPYWGTVVVTAVVAAIGTGTVNAITRSITDDRTIRTLVNTAAFLSIYGASFLLKYRIFHRIFHVQHPNVPQATLDLTAADGERTPAN